MTVRGGEDSSAGVGLAFASYGLWGTFPLYFALLRGVAPVELVAHRVVWSLLFCAVLLAVVGRRLGGAVMRRLTRRQFALLTVAALALGVNWLVFLYAVESGQVVQSSLGYFTNPLVSVLLGVLVLGERLRRVQWVALGIAAAAVVVLTVEAGAVPWIALTLAVSFGCYGLLKNRVGQGVGALPGMTVETAVLAVPAAAVVVAAQAGGHGALTASWSTAALLIASGPLTAGVLMLFAAAARRIRLSTLGLVQYVTPVLQLLCGLVVLGERMTPGRWVGFALVWAALILLSGSSLMSLRERPAAPQPVRRPRFGQLRSRDRPGGRPKLAETAITVPGGR